MDAIWQDVRYAVRLLRLTPGTTTAAIVTLALGMGANTATFSVVHAVLLQSLPYPRPDQLVTITESNAQNDVTQQFQVAPGDYLDFRNARSFAEAGAFDTFSYSLTGSGAPERVIGAAMSAGLFHLLGSVPAIGRGILAGEDRPDGERVVVLSDGLWRRRFNADPSVAGRSIVINGAPYTIVGVMPADYRFPAASPELWVALERQIKPEDMRWRGSHYLTVIARLRDGVSIDAARSEAQAILAAAKRANPDMGVGAGVVMQPLRDTLVREIRPALLVLFGAVALVLLVACANVGNLVLARATARQREMAIRLALGSGRARLIRQLVVEHVLLACAGGAVGLGLAVWVRNALVSLSPATLPAGDIGLDGSVLAFTFAVAAATGVAFGLVPALTATRVDLRRAIGARGTTRREGGLPRELLVGGQIAICIVLVAGAGLLVRSFANLRGLDLQFHVARILTARISLPNTKYSRPSEIAAFFDRAVDEVRRIDGVRDASFASFLPLTGTSFDNAFEVEGRPLPRGQYQFALFRTVDERFLPMFGIPVIAGRNFTVRDDSAAPPVVVVNEAMARKYFAGVNPIGRRITIFIGDQPPLREVIGVVRDVRVEINADPQPTMYVPNRQLPGGFGTIAVVTTSDRSAITKAIAAAVQRVDPDQPIYQVRSMEDVVTEAMRPWRFSMTLISAFAALALALAGIGVAGVTAYLVALRIPEIGIRMALGAKSSDVVRLIVGSGARVLAAGMAAGTLLAAASTRTLRSQLFNVDPIDPTVFATTLATLAALALLASWLPARRAGAVDPAVALREG